MGRAGRCVGCEIPKWPVASESFKLGGRSWLKAVDSAVKLASELPIVVLIGRAGMGKTQVMYEVCGRVECVYVDASEITERSAAQIFASIAWRLVSRYAGSAPRSRVVEAYRKFGYEGILSLARADPSWTLKAALELAPRRVVIALDELLPSAEDPKFFDVAYVIHRLRNARLANASFLISMLPEVYEKIVESIPPVGNMLVHVTVQLPDVIPEDEVEEIVSAYCPEKARLARKILGERPDITVRELLLRLAGVLEPDYVEVTPA